MISNAPWAQYSICPPTKIGLSNVPCPKKQHVISSKINFHLQHLPGAQFVTHIQHNGIERHKFPFLQNQNHPQPNQPTWIKYQTTINCHWFTLSRCCCECEYDARKYGLQNWTNSNHEKQICSTWPKAILWLQRNDLDRYCMRKCSRTSLGLLLHKNLEKLRLNLLHLWTDKCDAL